jgi:hypothetical protein
MTERFLLADEEFRASAADGLRHEEHKDRTANNHAEELQAEAEHDNDQRKDNDTGGNQAGDTLRDELTKCVDIIGIMAHDIAMGMGIKIFDGKRLHFCKHFVTHIAKRSLRYVRHDACPCKVTDKTREINGKQNANSGNDLGIDLGKRRFRAALIVDFLTFRNVGQDIPRKDSGNGVCKGA